MSRILEIETTYTIKLSGAYDHAYKFSRTKSLTESTQEEVASFIEEVGKTVKQETSQMSELQHALILSRNDKIACAEEIRQLEYQKEP